MEMQMHSEKATFGAVLATDPTAFVSALLLSGTFIIVLAIFVHSQVTGIQPKESWGEVAAGVTVIAAVLLGVMSHRVRQINSLLGSGHRQAAQIDRFLAVGIWTIVQLQYTLNGVQTERRIWLASSGRSRRLRGIAEAKLAMDSANGRRVVIADLYG